MVQDMTLPKQDPPPNTDYKVDQDIGTTSNIVDEHVPLK